VVDHLAQGKFGAGKSERLEKHGKSIAQMVVSLMVI